MAIEVPPAAFLFDLDGVLYDDSHPIPGGPATIQFLRSRNCPVRFVTNTTSRCRATLALKLQRFGIPAAEHEIFSPVFAAAHYLREKDASALFLLADDARRDVEGIQDAMSHPDYVVLGDLGDQWTYASLNTALRHLLGGAKLIALGMTRYWHAGDGPRLDVGPFASGLCYATEQQPIVLGKPAADFFRLAARDVRVEEKECLMIGDDILTDIGGAQSVGMRTVLVRTGKFRPADLDAPIQPDSVIDSVADLPALLKGLKPA